MSKLNQIERAFKFSPTSQEVRSLYIDNEPWFIAKDICDILDHTNASVAIKMLDEDERAKQSLGRQGKTWLINESGLYTLILRSNKPEAKMFRRWVTKEVLPAIRKQGYYGQAKKDNDFIDARDIPFERKEVNGYLVRHITLNGTVWVPVNDVNRAMHSSTDSGQLAKKLNAKQELAVKIWLFGNTHPCRCTNELGLNLIISGSRKFSNANQLKLSV